MRWARIRRRRCPSTRSCDSSAGPERCLRSATRSTGCFAPFRQTRHAARRRPRRPDVRIGRIPYVNCYPVYGAIDRGVVRLDGSLVTGVPSALNRRMAEGTLDISVVSAVEYARDARRYLLLPELAISCNGPVRSVLLFSHLPAGELGGRRVIVSRSSMTSVALLELLFEHVWHARPEFVPGDAEMSDIAAFEGESHEARLVIGDAALLLGSPGLPSDARPRAYGHVYDLGAEWKRWTGLPFVFAVWVARRHGVHAESLGAHAALLTSRD